MAHYLYVELNDITKLIFRDDDKDLLEYLEEDGMLVQPKWYWPAALIINKWSICG